MAFKFLVYVSDNGDAALCEGGVYTDAALVRGDGDYAGNTIAAGAAECADLNAASMAQNHGAPYELRDSLAGVDLTDKDVLSSLAPWQLTAITEKHVFQDGRDFYIGNENETESTVSAPMRVADFDTKAAADARDWFVKVYAPMNGFRPVFAGETF